MKVSIRELRIEDAKVSWRWRNDPEIWKFTGRKWDSYVTQEIEEAWIRDVRHQKNSKRFAICVGEKQRYVGNVQLTEITETDAVFHIFIGDMKYWGKGIAQAATKLIICYAANTLKLSKVLLKVNKDNIAAIKVYEKIGFRILNYVNEGYYLMILENEG